MSAKMTYNVTLVTNDASYLSTQLRDATWDQVCQRILTWAAERAADGEVDDNSPVFIKARGKPMLRYLVGGIRQMI